jgi:hypothetical protein
MPTIAELFYTMNSVTAVEFIPINTAAWSGIRMLYMTDASYVLDPTSTLVAKGYRIPVQSNLFTYPKFTNVISIEGPEGSVMLSGTYDDLGSGYVSSASQINMVVLGASGAYTKAKTGTLYTYNADQLRRKLVLSS